MTKSTTFSRFLFFCGLLLLGYAPARAQVTTASLGGKVLSDKGEELIGVSVAALHVPTGIKRGTATDADGRFTIPNLAAGGPYVVVLTYVGYKSQSVNDVFLSLGNTTNLNVALGTQTQQLAAVVVQTSNTQAAKTGAGTTVSNEMLQQLPTISRGIQDFTRLDPRSANNSFAGSSFRYNNVTLDGAINNDAIGFSPSLGGVSGTSGLPGSSARSNPISLDAIQEIQVQVAPFDVRLGNFTGGSVNAVTRSGTNDFHGSIYGYGRNQNVTGTGVSGTEGRIGDDYYDFQTGFRVGGPVVKNRLFFFANAEVARNQTPLFYGAGQPGAPVSGALAQVLADKLKTINNYEVGQAGAYSIYANSDKLFGRLDFNLNDKTSIALRHNFIQARATNLERSNSLFKFGSQDFEQNNVQNSTVLEVKSNFSARLANNFIAGYTNIHDYRGLLGGQSPFPQVQIGNVGPEPGSTPGQTFRGSGQVLLGSDREASIFNMKQKTLELTDNLTYFAGPHTLTLGTHNELYSIDYGFINAWNGRVEYNNVDDFLADKPNRIRGTYRVNPVFDAATPGSRYARNGYDDNYNTPSGSFRLNLFSAYLQDEWRVSDRLKITPGLRVDLASLPDKPALNAALVTTPANQAATTGATYNHTPWAELTSENLFGKIQFSPRIGINYDARGDQSLVLRGGSGLFTGRVPFAWLGYAFYNNGVDYNSVDLNNIRSSNGGTGTTYQLFADDPTRANLFGQLPASAQSTTEVNLIDKDFKMPQVWRSSLAVDARLPGGLRASLEGLFTKVVQDVTFQNINLLDRPSYFTAGPTGPPRYNAVAGSPNRVNSNLSNAFLMTNTQEGYRYQLTGSLGKTVGNFLDLSAAYTYGQSKDISNGIRNSFQSNWELNPSRNVNNPELAFSNFDLRHRVVGTLNLHKSLSPRFTGYFTAVLTYASGSPFTYVYNNNFFGNGQQNVQLAFVPEKTTDIVLVNPASVPGSGPLSLAGTAGAGSFAELDQTLSADPYLSTRRGQYTERNAARTPWNNQADVRFMLETKLGRLEADPAGVVAAGHTLQLSFDIVNVGNLLSNEWGRQYFVPNTFNSTAGFGLNQVGYADAQGNLVRNLNPVTVNNVVVADAAQQASRYTVPAFTYSVPAGNAYSIDQLASRWQGQVAVRYSF